MKYKAIVPYHSFIEIEIDTNITGDSEEEMEKYVDNEINEMDAKEFEDKIMVNLIDDGQIDFIKQ